MVTTYETVDEIYVELERYAELLLPTVTTYETLAGRYVELLLPTVFTYETLAGRYVGLLPLW